ncbi:MAG: ATP-binding protein [Desulfobacterales bacterium]|nr:ATP-binding protein [Desulfobacterales bacterium]
MLADHGTRVKRNFSPVYLAILSGIVLTILIINGLLEVSRARNGFYLLLEREGIAHLQYLEKNIQESIESLPLIEGPPGTHLPPALAEYFLSLEESVAEYLVAVASRLDQAVAEKPLTPSDLQSMADQYGVTSIEIYDPKGNRLRGGSTPSESAPENPLLRELFEKKRSVAIDLFGKQWTGEAPWFFVAISRKSAPGVIALYLNRDQMERTVRQFAVQRAISDSGLREGILYVSVVDTQLNTLGHTDPVFIGNKLEDPFLRNALQSDQPASRLYRPPKGDEIFEVAKSFSIDHKPMGLIRIGYSQKEIHPILSHIMKNVILSILFFLILGIAAVAFVWVNQNRHLKKMKEMEDRIQLAERLSSLGHLAAGVAHEIRNPLNAIGMGLQRLKKEFLPEDPLRKEEYIGFADLISKEIRRVNEIVEQFLNLSRPFQLNRRMSSLEELLKSVSALFQEEAHTHGITIQTEIRPGLPWMNVDPERLTQAFINIMKNGIQAMDHGGKLRIESRALKDRVEVVISDTGAGIPPDQIEKVFNYYYTTREQGVGLGLPIAHRIIEAHGGQLSLESRVGSGTAVTVTLLV